MNAQAYKITCLTNLHAGTGAADQGVIDNLVQRDHVDNTPCIYASSLKGALREYFEECLDKSAQAKGIFGKDMGSSGNKQENSGVQRGKASETETAPAKGSHIFYDALLLSIPARSNHSAFYQVTSWRCLERISEMNKMLGLPELSGLDGVLSSLEKDRKKKFWVFLQEVPKDLELEFWKYNSDNDLLAEDKDKGKLKTSLEQIFGDNNYIILGDEDFDILVSDYFLPVIARNQLDNGISQNLFYEQVMPRQSRFVFWTDMFPVKKSVPEGNTEPSSDLFLSVLFPPQNVTTQEVNTDIVKGRRPVQIGANASIGYGYCKIEHLDFKNS